MKIVQKETYRGNDWWDWEAWIESYNNINSIKEVTWLLHSTYSPNVIKTADNTGPKHFLLKTSGWGTFTLRAELLYLDGKKQILTHELELYYPDEKTTVS